MSFRRTVVSLASISLMSLTISGCSVLEQFGLGDIPEAEVELVDPAEETGPSDPTPDEVAEIDSSEDLTVPTCDTIYSQAQTTALLGEVRVSIGETSEGDFGYGTTNRDLVSLVKNVRRDLRISCTWYLPASESVSVTSVAIVSSDLEADVSRILGGSGANREELGGGTLWTIDSTNSDESPDYIATEAHFLSAVPCPSSLADQSCAVWVSSNYAFGSARDLTVDAATQLGILTP